MNTKTLNSREFFRSPGRVARLVRAGTKIVVTSHGEELFEAVPRLAKKGKTIKDFEDLVFSDPKLDRDLSKKVDEIVYGDL
ncbi:hypothetical protein HY968_02565 [Candidatus Kaiserbacteria bacterium]|nr:hypothetical protein [Candidatus Kaiserbacteria bacterium]